VPSPWPVTADVSAIHCVVVDADHVQSRFVLTLMVPVMPSAGADEPELAAVTLHLTSVGAVTFMDEEPHATLR